MKIVLATAALTLAAACSTGGPSVVAAPYDQNYRVPSDYTFAGGGRDLRVDIVGQAFTGNKTPQDQAITMAMAGHHVGQPINFTTTPGDSAREAYKVVLSVNETTGATGNALCRGDFPETADPGTRAPEAPLRLHGAFCRGGKALADVTGRTGQVASLDDPRFSELVGHVTRGLFPLQNPDADRGNCPRFRRPC